MKSFKQFLAETWYNVKGHDVTTVDKKHTSGVMSQHKDLNEPVNLNHNHNQKWLDDLKKTADILKNSKEGWRKEAGRSLADKHKAYTDTYKKFRLKNTKLKVVNAAGDNAVKHLGK